MHTHVPETPGSTVDSKAPSPTPRGPVSQETRWRSAVPFVVAKISLLETNPFFSFLFSPEDIFIDLLEREERGGGGRRERETSVKNIDSPTGD